LDPQAAGKDPLFTSLLGSICRLSAQSVPDWG
jgi:hypothetical protein